MKPLCCNQGWSGDASGAIRFGGFLGFQKKGNGNGKSNNNGNSNSTDRLRHCAMPNIVSDKSQTLPQQQVQ